MSVQQSLRSESHRRGQFLAGMLVFAGVLVVSALLPKLPWHLLDPVREFIGRSVLLNALAKAVITVTFVATNVIFLIWLERKVAGWLQARLGPMHVGWKGLAQTVADAVKLLLKEDIIPAKADRSLFIAAPFIAFVPTVLVYVVLPFSEQWVAYDYSLGLLFVLAVTTNVVIGIMAAGWGANNKYSLLGGARAAAQILAYEIPMIVVALTIVSLEGTLSLTHIVLQQREGWNIWVHWPVLVPAFLIFLTCALAELNRTPFDLPEAESELVSGFHTEYSGMRFAFFFLAEFANNFFAAGLMATLFFGGWLGPAFLPPVVWFALKTVALIIVMMWIRWTMPRLRIDQLMGFCWKLLVPASIAVFLLSTVWTVFLHPESTAKRVAQRTVSVRTGN